MKNDAKNINVTAKKAQVVQELKNVLNYAKTVLQITNNARLKHLLFQADRINFVENYGMIIPLLRDIEICLPDCLTGKDDQEGYAVSELQRMISKFYAYKREIGNRTAEKELLNMVKELYAWAESVEGHEVSRGITKWSGTVFEEARNLISKYDV